MSKKETARKKTGQKLTEYSLTCSCGVKSPVMELGNSRGFMCHCCGCGRLTFFHDVALLTRLSYGGQLCPHKPEHKPCPGGSTSWCDVCRVRVFYRQEEEAPQPSRQVTDG